MAKIWHNRILAGTRTYEEVPNTWKAQVKALFRKDVEDGVITEEQYEEIIGEDY